MMFTRLEQFFKPRTLLDKIGLLLVLWVMLPFLIPRFLLSPSFKKIIESIADSVFYISNLILPIPENAELEGIAYMMFGLVILIILINSAVVLANLLAYKKFSFYMLRLTLILVVFSMVMSTVDYTYSSYRHTQRSETNRKIAAAFDLSVDECEIEGTRVKCRITLSNIPEGVFKDAPLVYISYGSKLYERYTRKELEEDAKRPGSAPVSDWTIDVYNHKYNSEVAEIVETSATSITLATSVDTREKFPPESLYISGYELHVDFERYESPDIEVYLFK